MSELSRMQVITVEQVVAFRRAVLQRIAELEAYHDVLVERIKLFEEGYKGGCYACEPVGELNIKLEAENAALREAQVTSGTVFQHIKHGDDDHQAWLFMKLREVLPPPPTEESSDGR